MKRGLARTFQINTLFPHLSALEAVTLAVCERARRRRHLVAQACRPIATRSTRPTRSSPRCGSAPSCYRPTRELAYGQQRLLEIALALATKPKVLLLDEPAAGVPRDESARTVRGDRRICRSDITVLFIEHDMNVVFRFASRIIVMVGGRDPARRHARGDRRRSARARGLSGQAHVRDVMAEPLLALERRARRLRRRRRARRHLARAAGERQPRRARPQRRRQDDAAAHHHGLHTACRAARSAGAARTSRSVPPHRRARARARLGRAGARDLSLADGRGEPHRRRAARAAGTCAAVYELFPRLAERRAQHGQPAVRRRAADAGDRARADDQSRACCCSTSRSRASRRSSSRN